MYYKDDWPQARERFLAFWEGELVDRCCVAVQAPRNGSHYVRREPPESPDELTRWWLDPEDNLERMLEEFEGTYYGGEAYKSRPRPSPCSRPACWQARRSESWLRTRKRPVRARRPDRRRVQQLQTLTQRRPAIE